MSEFNSEIHAETVSPTGNNANVNYSNQKNDQWFSHTCPMNTFRTNYLTVLVSLQLAGTCVNSESEMLPLFCFILKTVSNFSSWFIPELYYLNWPNPRPAQSHQNEAKLSSEDLNDSYQAMKPVFAACEWNGTLTFVKPKLKSTFRFCRNATFEFRLFVHHPMLWIYDWNTNPIQANMIWRSELL